MESAFVLTVLTLRSSGDPELVTVDETTEFRKLDTPDGGFGIMEAVVGSTRMFWAIALVGCEKYWYVAGCCVLVPGVAFTAGCGEAFSTLTRESMTLRSVRLCSLLTAAAGRV